MIHESTARHDEKEKDMKMNDECKDRTTHADADGEANLAST